MTRIITEVAMKMHNPPHPGEILKELCLGPLGLTVTDAAKALGISRKTLSSTTSGTPNLSGRRFGFRSYRPLDSQSARHPG